MTDQALPSGSTEADKIARQLARLRGPEIQPRDGSLIAEDLRVQGGGLAEVRATIRRALAQAHPGTATDMLPELEEEYGLPSGAALATVDRQTNLLAKHRARGDGSIDALGVTVRTLIPGAVLIPIAASEVADTDPTAVFNLVILVPLATMDDANVLAQLDALLGQQVTSYAAWTYGAGAGPDIDPFLTDRSDSLVEIDLLAS